MDNFGELRKAVYAAVGEGDPEKAEHAANALNAAAQAQKTQLEAEALPKTRSSEELRFWVPVLGSIIGAVALVGTLMFQIFSFNTNFKLQEQAKEAADYRDVVQALEQAGERRNDVGLALLGTFLASPHYGKQARTMAAVLLGKTADVSTFLLLYPDLEKNTNNKNYDDLLTIDRELYNQKSSYENRLKTSGSREGADLHYAIGQVSWELQHVQHTLADLMPCAGGNVPRTCKGVISNNVDLSNASFYSTGLYGLDLSNANLENTYLRDADVRGTNFAGVYASEGSNWDGVKWWLASKMSLHLICYLKGRHAPPHVSDIDGLLAKRRPNCSKAL